MKQAFFLPFCIFFFVQVRYHTLDTAESECALVVLCSGEVFFYHIHGLAVMDLSLSILHTSFPWFQEEEGEEEARLLFACLAGTLTFPPTHAVPCSTRVLNMYSRVYLDILTDELI